MLGTLPSLELTPWGKRLRVGMAKGLFIGATKETLVREDWKPRGIE